jgi:hypothetical protein
MAHDPQQALDLPHVRELLAEPLLARLGTANPKTAQPHVTPVWYEWDGERLYISGFISTRKLREVSANGLVSILIDTDHPIRAVLMEGCAEVWDDPARVAPRAQSIYSRYVGAEGVQQSLYQSWVHDPENRIIALKPSAVYVWGWD